MCQLGHARHYFSSTPWLVLGFPRLSFFFSLTAGSCLFFFKYVVNNDFVPYGIKDTGESPKFTGK